MLNRWNDQNSKDIENDQLALRVYTSQLLGQESGLVLHGGGNTSVKINEKNFFGKSEKLLYVKGSGWDLVTIEKSGFAPVKMDTLLELAELEYLTDSDMVRLQRAAMIDPGAPTPSVEAILHAIIPYTFVDHTHADAVVVLSNTPEGDIRIKELYGSRVLLIPYVMPGFILARAIVEKTKSINWKELDAIILLNHGVFTFADTAKVSYSKMIDIVSSAENYLYDVTRIQITDWNANDKIIPDRSTADMPLLEIARIRKLISNKKGRAMLAITSCSEVLTEFSKRDDCAELISKGPLTPDHVIRTKPTGAYFQHPVENVVERYSTSYKEYFEENTTGDLQCLDMAPRWGILPNVGSISFGRSINEARIVADIIDHTVEAINIAEEIGGWTPLSRKDIFEMEYWELEQAKLKKNNSDAEFQGQIALVTGAASGIGYSCVQELIKRGSVVVALDIDPTIENLFESNAVLPIICDVTNSKSLELAVKTTVKMYGGIDLLVSNAGYFPIGETIDAIKDDTWDKSLLLNLTSHKNLLASTIPYLKEGVEPAVVIVGSKNVPAPGPAAGAYSVAKSGLTQLGRVAAMELGQYGIRVNTVHPNAVFDTGVWSEDVLISRAKSYGMSVEEYKTNNMLQINICSKDVATLVCTMLGSSFSKTTGAQVPIDGGNERVI